MAVTFIPNPEHRVVIEVTQPGEEQREMLLKAARYIMAGFVWDDSAEGHAFWHAVWSRLTNIGHGEELK